MLTRSTQDTDPTAFVQALTDDKCDPKLGALVRQHLLDHNLEKAGSDYNPEQAFLSLQDGIGEFFEHMGFDLTDPSINQTPTRYAKMLIGELTKGINYDFFPKATTTPNDMAYDQMVIVQGISTISLCEHHLQTIDGLTYIAYIPRRLVLGLSKFARITDFFARRPQIQERMTEQLYHALSFILETDDIAVVQKATHYCMKARGALQHSSMTTTDKMGGRFMSNPALRKEFFDACK